MNVLLLNGPNLNLLGEREPAVYGTTTLAQVEQLVSLRGAELSANVRAFQSNHEGALLDRLHEARRWARGVLFNPGALTHYAWSLRDAVSAMPQLRVVEVHLSEPRAREPFRHVSVLEGVCAHRIAGKGVAGYLEGLEWLVAHADG
jgi:3-dehydroquinate dehydratase-2